MFEHVGTAFQAFLAVHGVALAIVNLTPTPKDDEILKAVYKVIEILAGVVTPRAKK